MYESVHMHSLRGLGLSFCIMTLLLTSIEHVMLISSPACADHMRASRISQPGAPILSITHEDVFLLNADPCTAVIRFGTLWQLPCKDSPLASYH